MAQRAPHLILTPDEMDVIASDAWAKMKRGVSLAECAHHAQLHLEEMDLIVWDWCARRAKAH